MTLTLNTTNQFSCMTLRLMIIHHNTKCGYKRLSGSGDIVWTAHGRMDTRTDGRSDSNIPPLSSFRGMGGGGASTTLCQKAVSIKSQSHKTHLLTWLSASLSVRCIHELFPDKFCFFNVEQENWTHVFGFKIVKRAAKAQVMTRHGESEADGDSD